MLANRIAGVMAVLAFVICVASGLGAGNEFATVITRALIAMAVTVPVAYVLGTMAQAMIDENLRLLEEKTKNSSAQMPEDSR